MERKIPIPGEIYKHFKNKLYQIVTIATHSETGEKLVIYQALYGDFSCCARPLDMFLSEVDHIKYKDVSQKYRFELVSKDEMEPVHKDEVHKTENVNIIIEEIETSVAEEGQVNPDLMDFLNAETYEEKKNLLILIKNRINDELINSMAASLDTVVEDGDLDTRYTSLLKYLSTMQRYEVTNRLR